MQLVMEMVLRVDAVPESVSVSCTLALQCVPVSGGVATDVFVIESPPGDIRPTSA
jgi:hypothetical protein